MDPDGPKVVRRKADDADSRFPEFASDVAAPACAGLYVGAGEPWLDGIDHFRQVAVKGIRYLLALLARPIDENVHVQLVVVAARDWELGCEGLSLWLDY